MRCSDGSGCAGSWDPGRLVGLRDRIMGYLAPREGEMIELLEAVVNIDSGTGHAAGLNQVAEIFRRELERSGVAAQIVPGPAGNHLLGRRAADRPAPDQPARSPDRQPPSGRPARSLVVGHLDTVFPVGTAAERPFSIQGRRAFGPGVEDMKSGLVGAVFAARALSELGLWPGHQVSFIFNADEEIRSPSSAHLFAQEGGVADECYVLEGARDDGSVVTARKGSARFQVHVQGRPSHSGANHPDGRSAIQALAHKVLALESLTDYDAGTTVNVGVIRGGLSFNTVPGEAWCDLDIRALTPAHLDRVSAMVHAIASRQDVPGTSGRAEGGITRPPMERTPGTVAMFEACRRLAALLGRQLTESLTGGGSDGCLTAAAGAPTLDGLGPGGGQAHTPQEWLDLDTLVPSAALLALALATGPHARRP